MRKWILLALIIAVVFLSRFLSPVVHLSDSFRSVPTAISILTRGSTSLDDFSDTETWTKGSLKTEKLTTFFP
jgi:hypothetical protein